MSPRRTDNDEQLEREDPEQGRAKDALDPDVSPEDDAGGDAPSIDELAAAAAEAEADAERTMTDARSMQAALGRMEQEAKEAQDRYLRTYAEFENYRKRTQRDLAEFRKYANEQLALDLLTVVDHLGLAIRHAQESGGAGQGLQEGVELVHRQFLDLLEKYGIKPFKAEGEPFDPKLHDAMMQVETADAPANTVVQVFQEGYLYHEKVLRHARVGVSKRPAGAEETGEQGPQEAAAAETTNENAEDEGNGENEE